MRIAVIADDLTGALDTGVQFSNWGLNVQVTDKTETSTAEVVVINTDSRNLPQEEAYNIVYNVAKKVTEFDIIYKKVDSTLRGNVGLEIQAVLDATKEKTAILTPCYPPTKRSVKNGHLLVNGIPINETEYATEHSTSYSLIQDIIGNLPQIIVIDSETEADLLNIVQHHTQKILIGSAGLAAAVAEKMANPNPVLSVIGSKRTVAQHQIKVLEHRLSAKLISLDYEAALNRIPQKKAINVAVKTIENGTDVIISSAPYPESVEKTKQIAAFLELTTGQIQDHINTSLAETAKKIIETTQLSGLILSGGETAMTVCRFLSISEITIIEELRPGIPLLKLDNIHAVTKAGGFGEPDALIQATQYLKRKRR